MVSSCKTTGDNKISKMGPSQIVPSLSPLRSGDLSENTSPEKKRRKIEPTEDESNKLTESRIGEAFATIKKTMVKIEKVKIENKDDDYEEEDDGAFTKLRIRPLDEIQSDSDFSEGECEEKNTKKSASPPSAPLPTRLVDFGPGVYLASAQRRIPNPVWSNSERLCFNCKEYGHIRSDCANKWYHWWPTQYLNKHPWLRVKVRESRQLKTKGYWYFRQFHAKLEEEASDREWEELRHRKRPTSRYYEHDTHTSKKSQSPVNRFETPFLTAVRRYSTASKTKKTRNIKEVDTSPTDFGNALDIFERLQSQIEELKKSLDCLKMHQEPNKLSLKR